ncbi:sensor histidine kinase, partial [Salmonella enterica subsp. enterica serovar Alachua]|nr:sensor histidine kinase [Salmonella enterica subsp. enterica serovar Alachua]
EEAKPSVLQLFGFAQATENHLDRSIRESGAAIEWFLEDQSDGMTEKLEETVATALFRIVQEAINNAIRHALAGEIHVRLRNKAGRLLVEVTDNGIGMDRQVQRIGHGIDNMRTRARLISANFAIRKNMDGSGTCVTIHLQPEMYQPIGG